MSTFKDVLGELSGGKVLDVATGKGNFVRILMNNLRDYAEIVGIDNNLRSIEAAQEAFSLVDPERDLDSIEDIRFMVMDATCMDFANQTFDTVCISNSLHHMADLSDVLAEMLRVLIPGGRFILSEVHRDGQAEPQMTHVQLHDWWSEIDRGNGISHHPPLNRAQISEIAAGLRLAELQTFDVLEEINPKDPELIQDVDAAISAYMERAKLLPNRDELIETGKRLRVRVHETGFCPCTVLLITGKKV